MLNNPELRNLLVELWTDLHDIKVLWQVGAVALCLFITWLAGKVTQPQMAAIDSHLHLPKSGVGREALAAIQFPFIALLLLLLARLILGVYKSNLHLLNLMIALMSAAVILKLAIVMLRQVFAPSGWRDALIRVIAWAVWIGFAIYVAGLAPDLLKFLDDIGFTAGKQRISLLLILQALLWIIATLLIALWLGRFIEARAMAATGIDINLRVMVSKLAQALLVLIAIFVALPAVGIDLTVLSVFGGALGVGIGFGLQKIASNYVSGFLILMDRSVSPGDLVTIDNQTGLLTKMTTRYVVVRSLAGVEAIIPNDTLITSTVINHSYSDRRVRQAVVVQVSYDTDLDAALRILEETGARQPRVLKDPAPNAIVAKFADSGIDLELGLWIEDPHAGTAGLRSDLYLDIWRAFRKHNIEIPFPQREVRFRNGLPPGVVNDKKT